MLTVHHAPAPVQSEACDGIDLDIASWLPAESEPFQPSEGDLAYDLAYGLARDGEIDGGSRMPFYPDNAVGMRWIMGKRAGMLARESDAAREAGRLAGLLTGSGEPPAGYRDHEKAAYRDGFAAGELEDAILFDHWVRDMEAERLDWAMGRMG